jgi:hypothetical protein
MEYARSLKPTNREIGPQFSNQQRLYPFSNASLFFLKSCFTAHAASYLGNNHRSSNFENCTAWEKKAAHEVVSKAVASGWTR